MLQNPNWRSSSSPVLQREPDQEEQPEDNMPPKFKRHLNDDEVTGSIRSERVRARYTDECVHGSQKHYFIRLLLTVEL